MQTYCTRTHMSICTLPRSCTKVVPIHCLCIVYPSPVHVQRLYQNINNSNSVLNMYLHLYLYSTRTSTVPVHTKYIPVASTYKYLCGVKTPPTLKARFITLPSIRQNATNLLIKFNKEHTETPSYCKPVCARRGGMLKKIIT